MDRAIKEICKFLNISREHLILSLDKKSLDNIINLWDNDDIIKVHNIGYELKG